MRLLLLTSLSSVSSCGTVPGNCSAIPLKEYDAKFTADFVEQSAGIPDASAVGIYLTDANVLRGDVRACKARK